MISITPIDITRRPCSERPKDMTSPNASTATAPDIRSGPIDTLVFADG
jgi:hypothetical protein